MFDFGVCANGLQRYCEWLSVAFFAVEAVLWRDIELLAKILNNSCMQFLHAVIALLDCTKDEWRSAISGLEIRCVACQPGISVAPFTFSRYR